MCTYIYRSFLTPTAHTSFLFFFFFTLPIGHSIRIRKEEEEEEEGCKMMTGKVRFATYREKK